MVAHFIESVAHAFRVLGRKAVIWLLNQPAAFILAEYLGPGMCFVSRFLCAWAAHLPSGVYHYYFGTECQSQHLRRVTDQMVRVKTTSLAARLLQVVLAIYLSLALVLIHRAVGVRVSK